MKALLTILCFFTFTLLHAGTILILNFGESNLVGRSLTTTGATVVANYAGTKWYKYSTNTLENFNEASTQTGEGGHASTTYSMNPYLAKRLKDLTGENVIIIPAAWGGTPITDWEPGTGLYNEALTMYNAAVAYCAANGITISHKFVHFHQGGNDTQKELTDGYYLRLKNTIEGIAADFAGVEKVFASRFGYDPNYVSAAGTENITRAHKIFDFNSTFYQEISRIASDPSFTYANGFEEVDLVHYTLKGGNAIAEEWATNVAQFISTGSISTLSEPCVALQSVTNGTIDLTKQWLFDFNGVNTEAGSHNTVSVFYNRSGSVLTPSYESGTALIFPWHSGFRISRQYKTNVFYFEARLKLSGTTGEHCIVGDNAGSYSNKFLIEAVSGTGSGVVYLNGTSWAVTQNWAAYHTYTFIANGSTLTFKIDGTQQGSAQSFTASPSFQYVGLGHDSQTKDFDGTVDYLKMVDNTTGTIDAGTPPAIIVIKGRRAVIQ